MPFMDEFYFESAAMILTLINRRQNAGGALQGQDHRRAQIADEARPSEATVIRGGEELTIPAEQLAVGDIFAVKPGESILLTA